MKLKKIFICIVIICNITFNITSIFAVPVEGDEIGGSSTSGNIIQQIIDNVTGKGSSGKEFGKGGEQVFGTQIVTLINETVIPLVFTIGNLIFYAVAAFLGVKYIWSSVEGKSVVKQSLPTFVVAAIMFYLANTIYTFSTTVFTSITESNDVDIITGNLWANISIVINILAIAGIVALGLKYMFAPADTKADIKEDLMPVFIGLVLVYSVTNVLSFIASVATDVIPLT